MESALNNDKIMLEKVRRRAARYIKGEYRYDASVTEMLNDLNWESLESCREQFTSLIMLYNILKQNTYLPLEYTPEFHPQTSLQTRARHMFTLTEHFCNTDTYKFSFYHCHRDYGIHCQVTLLKVPQRNLLNQCYFYALNS